MTWILHHINTLLHELEACLNYSSTSLWLSTVDFFGKTLYRTRTAYFFMCFSLCQNCQHFYTQISPAILTVNLRARASLCIVFDWRLLDELHLFLSTSLTKLCPAFTLYVIFLNKSCFPVCQSTLVWLFAPSWIRFIQLYMHFINSAVTSWSLVVTVRLPAETRGHHRPRQEIVLRHDSL